MPKPTFADYLGLLRQLFQAYQSACPAPRRRGRPYTYVQESLLLFFAVMLLRHKLGAKAQRRWLEEHPDERKAFGLEAIPRRWTLSRRWKKLYPTGQAFIAWLGDWAEALDEAFQGKARFEAKSLFKALGPVWHQKDRKAGRIPEGLRTLDQEAPWSKAAYHGWVYGSAGHWTPTPAGFPRAVEIKTASVSESEVIDRKAEALWEAGVHTLTADTASCNLKRVRRWAKHGVVLIPPALKVASDSPQGGPSKAFVAQPENAALLKARKTAPAPLFDLIAQLSGAGNQQKQLPVQGGAKVRTCLALATLLAQLAMRGNSIWGMPFHNLSHMLAVFP